MKHKVSGAVLLAVVLVVALILPSAAQSTTKSMSTNFTLVNLSDAQVQGTIQYLKPDGSAWKTDDSFQLAAGGQAVYRQYSDGNLTDGRGSVVVSSDGPVGAVVQQLARNQNPTSSGAYAGISDGAPSYFVPLVARNKNTASGLGNSQIAVQNTTGSDVTVEIQLVGSPSYLKSGITIKPNASYLYDLAQESSSNVPNDWLGSAVVNATNTGGKVAVVSNFFTGDAMQSFNAYPSSAPGMKWFVPQFTSRLANSLSTPISIQNLSGGEIAIGGVSVTCTPTGGGTGFTMQNTAAIPDSGSYGFNPVVDTTIPAGFEGACTIDSSADIVAFVQMRFISQGEAAAYEAFPPSTDKKLIVPLVAKRLSNGFSTAVTIQNLGDQTTTVHLKYTPSATECSGCVAPEFDADIPAGGNLIQNQGITSGANSVPQLPSNWQGTLVVTSPSQPIAGFVQLRFRKDINPGLPNGDLFMAHDAFTQP